MNEHSTPYNTQAKNRIRTTTNTFGVDTNDWSVHIHKVGVLAVAPRDFNEKLREFIAEFCIQHYQEVKEHT